jgi:hypothetical protein
MLTQQITDRPFAYSDVAAGWQVCVSGGGGAGVCGSGRAAMSLSSVAIASAEAETAELN